MPSTFYRRFEKNVAVVEIYGFIVEDDLIPVVPETPTSSNHRNLEESIIRPVFSIHNHLIQLHVVSVPCFTNFIPKSTVKLHEKKRCCIVSISALSHKTQSVDSTWNFFLASRSLVLYKP